MKRIDNTSLPTRVAVLVGMALVLCSPAAFADIQDPVSIAAIFSLTGPATYSNRSSVLGTRLAVDEINNQGGVSGHNINLIFLDDMSTPIGASLAANQAVAAGVAGIIGDQRSSLSLAIANVAQPNRIPMISHFSTSPKLTRIGDYIFRVCFTDDFQGKVMAEFAHQDLGAHSAYIFVDLASDYSLDLARIFRSHFESLGGIVLSEIEYKATREDYDPLVSKVRQPPADVIFLSGHDESGLIAYSLQQAGIASTLLGGDGWETDSFSAAGGKYLKKGYFCTHWSEASESQVSRAFIEKYGQHADFGAGAALAYDAVMVMARAIEKAGSTQGADVVQALRTLEPYEGITGMIQFDANGDPVKHAVIMEIQDGRPYYLKTLIPQ
jgi:branched-chain amino acid transport system substrate-binding protein